MANALEIPNEVTAALAEVRADKSKLNFAVVGYDETNPKALALLGTGSNGVEGIKSFLKANDVNYCLLRIDFNYETVGVIKADTTRFMFIYLRPESVPLKRKMMLGSVEGQIKKLFSPFIRTYEVDTADDITEEKISEMVDTITMTKNKVTDRKADNSLFIDGKMVNQRSAESDKTKAILSPDSRAKFIQTKGAEVTFDDLNKLTEAIKDVRDDANECRWCLFSYKDKKTLAFHASGNGDVSELLAACEDDKISYGLFRFVEKYGKGIDQVKFGFVTWVPEDGISPTMKAVVSTHKGEVVDKFRPFHVQFYVQKRDELNEEKALDAIASLTGSKSHVTDKKAVKKEEVYERKMLGGTTKNVQELKFKGKDELVAAIKEVRDDKAEVDFAIAAFEGDKKNLVLAFVGSGTGLVNIPSQVSDDAVQYILTRTSADVDGYATTKFTLIKYDGANVGIGYKGACGVFHGAVTEVFGAVHSNADVSSKDELVKKLA